MWNNSREPKEPVGYTNTTPLFSEPEQPKSNDAGYTMISRTIRQPESNFSLITKDETEVMSEARMRLIFGQDEPVIVKYICKNLDITSDQAQHKLTEIKSKLHSEFNSYIRSCTEDNIMILKTMLSAALEKKDFRNATDIMTKLDQLTDRYMDRAGMIVHRENAAEENKEIEVIFS